MLWAWALALTVATTSAQRSTPTLTEANAAVQAGEADKALSLLQPLTQAGVQEAEAHNLVCRVRYELEEWNNAVNECELAVRLDEQNSGDHLWLGRALGQKASQASFLSAYSLAKRVRAEFEEAVRLNPRNAEALISLGEFYKEAPGVVGGGMDKAKAIAAQLEKVDPARAHQLRAGIAEKRKDHGTAEREFKLAIATSAHPALQWALLADFYRQRERWTEMESAVQSGESLAVRDKQAGVALFNGASVLTDAHRDPALAAKLLSEYLAGAQKNEDAPAFVAHIWLARLKQQLGDGVAAQRERAAALALAHEYKPALDSIH